MAAEAGHFSAVKTLVDKGANISTTQDDGVSVWDYGTDTRYN